MPENAIIIKIKKPIFSRRIYLIARSNGKKNAIILLPSSGGIGMRLKSARIMLIIMPATKISLIGNRSEVISHSDKISDKYLLDLKRIKNKKANKILAKGPAIDTSKISLLIFLKLAGFIGTGFAQPIILVRINMRVPRGSRCLRGFKVNLPAFFAVGSPSK